MVDQISAYDFTLDFAVVAVVESQLEHSDTTTVSLGSVKEEEEETPAAAVVVALGFRMRASA